MFLLIVFFFFIFVQNITNNLNDTIMNRQSFFKISFLSSRFYFSRLEKEMLMNMGILSIIRIFLYGYILMSILKYQRILSLFY